MPGGAQLIHVAEGEKEAFVPVIALRCGRGSLGSVCSTSELLPLAFFDGTYELIFRTPVCLLYLPGGSMPRLSRRTRIAVNFSTTSSSKFMSSA